MGGKRKKKVPLRRHLTPDTQKKKMDPNFRKWDFFSTGYDILAQMYNGLKVISMNGSKVVISSSIYPTYSNIGLEL